MVQVKIHAAQERLSADGRLAIPGAAVDDACPGDELAVEAVVELLGVVDVVGGADDVDPEVFDPLVDEAGDIGPPGLMDSEVDMLVVFIGPPGFMEVICDAVFVG